MKKVVIYGAGAYGKLFFCEADRYGAIDIVAFTVDEEYLISEKEFGIPVVPFEMVESIYPPEEYDMIVLCGYTIMRNRPIMYNKAKAKGYQLINYISPKAMLETDIKMGDNNIIMANAIVGYDCVLGNDNVIRQGVYLGHESKVHNHSIISTGCLLGGRSTVEDMVFFGIGVTARGYITYGKESLIGVGSNVTKNVEPYATCCGNPAKTISYHEDTGVIVKEANE